MPRSVYFLKANPVADHGSGDGTVPFACAEAVRRLERTLQAVNIQVPVCAWRDGGPKVTGYRLRDRDFGGYAYRIPAPEWFQFKPDEDRPGSQGPDPPVPAGRILHTTPLKHLCRHPDISMALAQDRLAGTLGPLLAMPDLLAGEERLLEDWALERPSAAAHAAGSAEAVAAACPGLSPSALKLRVSIRRSALRRMDAAAVGREIYSPCPAYFGEPHLAHNLDRSLTFKAGIVRLSHSWPSPETEARSRAWRADPRLVEAVEALLFPPLAASEGSPAFFSSLVGDWQATGPLRDFEASSPLPLFPRATIYPHGHLPKGFRLRISPEAVHSCGGSYLTLSAAGLSPYIAAPFDDYCRSHRDRLLEWSRDIPALAAAKWG